MTESQVLLAVILVVSGLSTALITATLTWLYWLNRGIRAKRGLPLDRASIWRQMVMGKVEE